jgi:hypothetical protein
MSEAVTRREAINKLAATAGIGALFALATPEAEANTKVASEPFHHEGKGDEIHIEWGIVRKAKAGALTVEFKRRFADPPVVILTPFWDGQGDGVGFIETLDHVSHGEFRLVSGNAADNYFVSWVAIGRRKQ